ncbi:hypothetical protein Bbelb_028960 [Branchiostoma belcheri]|nr:hypothetical protein Bbelb_028960 [Branchiostoma belcheri]
MHATAHGQTWRADHNLTPCATVRVTCVDATPSILIDELHRLWRDHVGIRPRYAGRGASASSTYEKECGKVKHTALPADQPPAVVPCTTVCRPRAMEMEMGNTLRSA